MFCVETVLDWNTGMRPGKDLSLKEEEKEFFITNFLRVLRTG
jgi:hypothetical protein